MPRVLIGIAQATAHTRNHNMMQAHQLGLHVSCPLLSAGLRVPFTMFPWTHGRVSKKPSTVVAVLLVKLHALQLLLDDTAVKHTQARNNHNALPHTGLGSLPAVAPLLLVLLHLLLALLLLPQPP
jgi:hypothetical protein